MSVSTVLQSQYGDGGQQEDATQLKMKCDQTEIKCDVDSHELFIGRTFNWTASWKPNIISGLEREYFFMTINMIR